MEEDNQFLKNTTYDKNNNESPVDSLDLLKIQRKLKKIVCEGGLIVYKQCHCKEQNETERPPLSLEQHPPPAAITTNRVSKILRTFSTQKCKTQGRPHEHFSPQNEEQAPLLRTRSNADEQIKGFRSRMVLSRLNSIKEDIKSHPIKYKIAAECIGIQPEKIYALKQSEQLRLREQYQRKKGHEYLRYARSHGKTNISSSNTESTTAIKRPPSPSRSRSYIRELFKDVAEERQKKIAKQREKQQKEALKAAQVAKLQEREWVLGKMVYDKVKKHIKTEANSKDFCRRVSSQETIDDALIKFLKAKIKKAETVLTKP